MTDADVGFRIVDADGLRFLSLVWYDRDGAPAMWDHHWYNRHWRSSFAMEEINDALNRAQNLEDLVVTDD